MGWIRILSSVEAEVALVLSRVIFVLVFMETFWVHLWLSLRFSLYLILEISIPSSPYGTFRSQLLFSR